MGCDIHFYTERLTSSNNYEGPRDIQEERDKKICEIINEKSLKERWVSADTWYKSGNSWYNNEVFGSRNYYLFSILADVRNRGDVEPISEPKGIPNDASSGYLYMANQWEGDGHSYSYFTLEELLNVDWDKYDKEYLEEFIKVVEDLKSIDEDPNKVRICFFFDN